MSAEQWHKGAKLVPTGLQFLPFGLGGLGVELAHYGESANVHAPERKAAHGVAKTRGHLHPHICPGGADISAPRGRRIALKAGEAVTGKEEHALVGVYAALAFIDGLGVYKGIGVEIFGGRAKGVWRKQPLHVVQRQAVPEVGLGGVHPPGIDLSAETGVQGLVHLPPEHLSATIRIGIIERLKMAKPVTKAVGLRMGICITGLFKLFVMVCIGVELGPDGNHETAIHCMHGVQHGLGGRIAGAVKLMTSPLVGFPVLPVLDNIVYGNVAAP